MKKFYRSNTNKVIFGLLGGMGEYWDRDPMLIRVLYMMITILSGVFPGMIAYFIGALMVPTAPVVVASKPADDAAEV